MVSQLPFFNKSLVTNLVAILFAVTGYFLPAPFSDPFLNIGLFAFSGALTNWLAIHMLFEKVPGFYGSGVIPARFEDFKEGIHRLIMKQVFTPYNVSLFFLGNPMGVKSGDDLFTQTESVGLDSTCEALIQ